MTYVNYENSVNLGKEKRKAENNAGFQFGWYLEGGGGEARRPGAVSETAPLSWSPLGAWLSPLGEPDLRCGLWAQRPGDCLRINSSGWTPGEGCGGECRVYPEHKVQAWWGLGGGAGSRGSWDGWASPARVDWKFLPRWSWSALPPAQPTELHQTLSYPGRGPGSLLSQASLQNKTEGQLLLSSQRQGNVAHRIQLCLVTLSVCCRGCAQVVRMV